MEGWTCNTFFWTKTPMDAWVVLQRAVCRRANVFGTSSNTYMKSVEPTTTNYIYSGFKHHLKKPVLSTLKPLYSFRKQGLGRTNRTDRLSGVLFSCQEPKLLIMLFSCSIDPFPFVPWSSSEVPSTHTSMVKNGMSKTTLLSIAWSTK